jgi:CRISPR-associated protein Cmr3
MCWYELNLEPRDILFFRDAKPMEASSVGSGANWPLPNVLHDALFHALIRHWPERQLSWEVEHKHKSRKDNRSEKDFSKLRFGGLKTAGLFPARDGELFFPCPQDIAPDGTLMQLADAPAHSNLPGFIEKVAVVQGTPSKNELSKWISSSELLDYLNGGPVEFPPDRKPLFDAEARPGIGMDPETGSVDTGGEDEGGKFYLAEYLRLRDGVTLRGFAKCESSLRGEVKADVLGKLFEEVQRVALPFGGQQGVATLSGKRTERPLSDQLGGFRADGCWVKWLLLSPAVFTNGWKPDWIDENGVVQLPGERPQRTAGQTREEWRKTFRAPPRAKLAAACLGKSIAFSGWNNRLGGPRPAKLAVPAGSVYWFRAESPEDAAQLAAALQGRCMSSFYGEKGFGLGMCQQQKI